MTATAKEFLGNATLTKSNERCSAVTRLHHEEADYTF